MIASVPSMAPIGPPLTGASRTSTSCRDAVTSSCRGVSGAIVECTTKHRPRLRAAPSAWPSTSRTWSSSRTITQSTSTWPASSATRRRRRGTGGHELGDRLGHDVVDARGRCVARREAQRHRLADVAEPDEPDASCRRKICPPSTARIWPVTHDASSESRNRHAPTMSSGWPIRLMARLLRTMSCAASPAWVRVAAVSVGPGAIALTRMFMPPSSWASCWVRPLMPTLARP